MIRTLVKGSACVAVLFCTAPALAQSQNPTQFVAQFTAVAPGEETVAERGEPILAITMRPELAVELTSVPDEAMQRRLGVAADAPLTVGTRLYGSSNRRSLYCHLINDRLVASSGTCFRDFDGDGDFEQGVKVEAPGLDTDVVMLRHDGAWHGGRFRERQRLDPALTYRPVPADAIATYPARVTWSASKRRPEPEDYPVEVTFTIMEGGPRQNTDVYGQCYVTTPFSGAPETVDFYGNTITVLGFTEDGHLRYIVEPATQETTIGMVYRFETRSAYVGIALAQNYRRLACSDPQATAPAN